MNNQNRKQTKKQKQKDSIKKWAHHHVDFYHLNTHSSGQYQNQNIKQTYRS